MRLCAVVCIVGAVASSGCNRELSAQKLSAQKITELEKRVAALEKGQEELKATTSVQTTEIQILNTSMASFPDRGATFQADSKGFQAVRSDYGVFLVSLADVKPYANGYKVTLNLGNPMAIDFAGVELGLRWGPVQPKEFTKENSFDAWYAQFVTSKQKLTQKLLSRSWNPVEVVLAPATATTIGQIEVTSISTDSVVLFKNR